MAEGHNIIYIMCWTSASYKLTHGRQQKIYLAIYIFDWLGCSWINECFSDHETLLYTTYADSLLSNKLNIVYMTLSYNNWKIQLRLKEQANLGLPKIWDILEQKAWTYLLFSHCI